MWLYIILSIIIVCCILFSVIGKSSSGKQYSSSSSYNYEHKAIPPKPIGTFSSDHQIVHGLKGQLMVVINYPECESISEDTFVALLGDNGKINNEQDLIFYNSDLEENWIFNGNYPEYTVKYSRDKSVYGPAVDYSYDNCADFYFIDLSKVSNEIKEIRFIHAVYEWEKYQEKLLNKYKIHNGFQIAIFALAPEEIRYLTHEEMQKHIDKLIVSDGIPRELEDKVNIVSASLIRKSDGEWTFKPIWEEFESIHKYFDNLLIN